MSTNSNREEEHVSHTHLTIDDRRVVATLVLAGHGQAEIARQVGKDQSSISREIRRNRYSDQRYLAGYAENQAQKRRKVANQCGRKLGVDQELTGYVIRKLHRYWSPEQIAGRIKRLHKSYSIRHTAIYAWIYQQRPDLVQYLRFHHNRYRRQYGTRQREAARKAEEKKRSIDTRPLEIESRATLGHWEGDTVVGSEQTTRILTHVERKSGYLLAQKLNRVSAELTRETTTRALGSLPSQLIQSITYDNGVEFSEYELLERELNAPVYFAHPYHSWERGTNENTNGLLRQFFPKRTAFGTITTEQLDQVVEIINHRPRKRLNYQTPSEILSHAIRTLI